MAKPNQAGSVHFTAELIADLVSCAKRVMVAPAKEFKEENRHRRKDMGLQPVDGRQGSFEVFIRQSLEFAEDFSLGLVFVSPEGKRMTLVRFNGQHDQTTDILTLENLHFQYHIHQATPENLNNGRFEKHSASVKADYASFEEATASFLHHIGVIEQDIALHFPGSDELPLFRKPKG